DSLGVTRAPGRAGGEYVAFLTANGREAQRGASGVLGVAESNDAIHWRALRPASGAGIFPNFIQ
ncbi:MAG TPA: hypothetical protein VIL86_05555, partial [Tepidisphaeraceae bacterium]